MGIDRRSRGDIIIGLPRGAFRPSPIFLGLVGLFVTSGILAWRGAGNLRIDVFLFVISGYLVSLCLHEYAHAVLAFRAGDVGVAARGYLTLNPLKYTHPLLSIVFPILALMAGGFGLPGGAVWVDHAHIRSKVEESLISAAGPATNVIFTGLLGIPFLLGVDTSQHAEFWAGLAFLTFLELTASLLNLVPVPGVDGGNMIRPWLQPKTQRLFNQIAPYGMIILIVLLFNRVGNQLFFGVVFDLGDLIGVPRDLYAEGFSLVRFWT
jgi:Zn-dependent protease